MTSVDTQSPIERPQPADTPPTATFSLAMGESTGSGLRRILLEQTEVGAWHLERATLADTHVHETRKATKRIRAVLRMLSSDIDPTDYMRLNVQARDLARELSQIRSAVVQVELLESLVGNDPHLMTSTRGLYEHLAATADVEREGLENSVMEHLSLRIRAVGSGIEAIELSSDETLSLDGIRRTYRCGRRSMAYAYEVSTIENFHIWRKQVKYLRHQMEILEESGAAAVSSLVADLNEIGEGLGVGNDLADLERAVDGVTPGALSSVGRKVLFDAIDRQRSELESRIGPVAMRVYAPKPAAFAELTIPRSG
jgi:CHAD domain-containing protein